MAQIILTSSTEICLGVVENKTHVYEGHFRNSVNQPAISSNVDRFLNLMSYPSGHLVPK